jgi:predicted transposase/invertase (TIGR01784 family)
LFARYTFSHPERAAAELRAVLPPELVAQVDWSSLQPESGSVVDPELRESQSDLLFSARLLGGAPLLFYFLLEHQSSVDPWMAFRMLRYVVRQLGHWRQGHPDSERLPIIIPMVMYHGPEGGWTAPRRVEELFHLPSEQAELWRARVPRFEHLVDDLTAEREEALRARGGPPLVPLALLLLRSGRSEQLAVLLEGWTPLLAEVLDAPEGLEQLRAIVHYLLRVGVEAALEALRRVLDSIPGEQRAEDAMRTMADALIEQGHERGLQEGMQKGLAEGQSRGLVEGQARGLAEGQAQGLARGRAESVLRLLAVRGIAVDERARALILSCRDLDRLDQWLERSVSATSLADVLATPRLE